jgi:tetratricopeptide (TPR) repeat protein
MDLSVVIATGQLTDQPLVELVRDIAEAKLSGAVRLVRDRVKAVIYFDAGDVVFAVSNLKQHRMIECATEWGFASAAQLDKIPPKSTEVEFGLAMVQAGVLTVPRLEELFERLTTLVLRHVLVWTDGEWVFDPRVRLAQSVRAQITVYPLLVEAVKKLSPDLGPKRLTNHKRQLTPVMATNNSVPLSPMDAFVFSRVENGMQLETLLEVAGLPQADLLRSVYALALGGLLHGSLWPEALGEVQIKEARKLASQTLKAPTRTAAIKKPSMQTKSSGAKEIGSKDPAAPIPLTAEETAVQDRRAADEYLVRVEHAKDFYDVLGILRASTDDEIKRAYFDLAKRFHPDRFHQEQGTRLHKSLQNAFARVSQAYDTLRDPKLRAAHDKRFESAGTPKGGFDPLTADPNAGTVAQQAEVRFQQGLAAIQNGNAKEALILCAQASRMVPNQARYRAGYGQALAMDPDKRHQAETEIKEAIKLEPKNAAFLVILAEFYCDLGQNRRAITELQRALAVDPNNTLVQRRLADLQM